MMSSPRSKEDVEQQHSTTNDQCGQSVRLTPQDHDQSAQKSQQQGKKDQCGQSVRLTPQDHDQSAQKSQQQGKKEAPAKQNGLERPHTPDRIRPTEVEVIKVYLEPRQKHKEESHRDSSAKMLTDEVSQIQEVRYCLKTLREQMASRQNNNNNKHPANGYRMTMPTCSNRPVVTNGNSVGTESDMHVKDHQEETAKLREMTKRLYAQLKEGEKRHQEEIHKLQAEKSELCRQLDEQSGRLQKAEEKSEERGQRVEELERLLGGMEIESAIIKDKMAAGEAELLQLKAERDEGKLARIEELEKEVALLREKIHHLDDMLKSQQRKVRHMIEQLQNSRTVIQERDRTVGDLEEKVAFLEAENREMQDHMEYFLGGQSSEPPQTSAENKPQVVYSKPLTPSTRTTKPLPFIKVIEIKS